MIEKYWDGTIEGYWHDEVQAVKKCWNKKRKQKQLRRNAARSDAVPEQAICHMMRELVPPEAGEGCRVEWHCV